MNNSGEGEALLGRLAKNMKVNLKRLLNEEADNSYEKDLRELSQAKLSRHFYEEQHGPMAQGA